MVTAVPSAHRPKRTPLFPSDTANGPPLRQPRAREVSSRYLSLSTTSSSSNSSTSTLSSVTSAPSLRRSQSPMRGDRKAVVDTPRSQQRAVSAERRRTPAKTPSSAERMLVASMRSLSVSFQGESCSLALGKAKPPPMTAVTPRKGTPERRKAGLTPARDRKEEDRENSRPINQQQQRWPGRFRAGENSSLMTRSLDHGSWRVQSVGSSPLLKNLRNSAAEVITRTKFQNNDIVAGGMRHELNPIPRSGDLVNSDVENISSESNSSGNARKGRLPGVVVPAKIWQDSSNRVQKMLYPDSPSPTNASSRSTGSSKLIYGKKFQCNSPVSSPRFGSTSRGLSPLRGGVVRPASPSKALISPTGSTLRGMTSPSRVRSGLSNSMNESNKCSSTPSMFHFAVDAKRGKLGEHGIADAHDLRLLYNRLLQWRLVNAKEKHTLLVQEQTAERSLYKAWVTNSKLQHLVVSKRIELLLLRHNLKLYSILKDQEPHLECWCLVDRDHCNSVSAAVEALKASTIRLPMIGGAKADVQKVQEAISSAVDIMQAMASSICSLLSKVGQMNQLASELSSISAQGHYLLDECTNFLSSSFIPLQVTHCSLRTQLLQVQQKKHCDTLISKW